MQPAERKRNPQFETPLKKLKFPLSITQPNFCLVLSGSFFPIHNNHIRCLEKVKEHLTQFYNYNVIGGYILPTHNSSLTKKLGNLFVAPVKRLQMYQLAVEDSPWIDVDPFLIMQPKNIGIEQATTHLRELLNKGIVEEDDNSTTSKPSIQVVSILGIDNILLVEKKLSKSLFIFVQNRPSMFNVDIQKWLDSEKVKPYKDNLIIVKDEDVPYEISSTLLREMIGKGKPVDKFMSQKVIDFINNEESLLKVFKSLSKNTTSGPDTMEYKPSQPDYGLKLDVNPEILQNLVDFTFQKIAFDKLTPELLYGQPWQLGKGLSSTVWAMYMKKIPVAVKIFNLGSQRGKRLTSFKQELRSLARIDHKYVVKCYGAGSIGNGIYIILERADPTNIWTFVSQNGDEWRSQGFSLEWIKAWANLAEGLQCMSDAGVLHRDLQLDNILLFYEDDQTSEAEKKPQEEQKCDPSKVEEDKDEEQKQDLHKNQQNSRRRIVFKVADFGVSSLEEDKDKVIRGSIRHYAPEAVLAKENYTSASDVYSFGLLLYEMIHAKRVWCDIPTSEVTKRIEEGKRPEFEVPCHDLVKKVINACWAQKPEDRPTFAQVAVMLDEAYKCLENVKK